MSKRKIILIIVLVIFFISMIPFALEFFVFRSNLYSVLDNKDWSGFLGSYIGGVLGSIGTLLAVYITTKETRKIQRDNLELFNAEQERYAKKERKQFADGVAQDIAKYITDISIYFNANRVSARLDKNRSNLENNLHEAEREIQKRLDTKREMNIEEQTNDY